MDNKEMEKWSKIRWITTGVYLFSVSLLTISMFLFPGNGEAIGIALGIWSLSALVPFFYILNIPYARWKKGEPLDDSGVLGSASKLKKPRMKKVEDHIPIAFILVVITLMLVLVTFVILAVPIIQGEIAPIEALISLAGTILFLGIIGSIFWKLDVEVDTEFMKFYWGPFGKKIPIVDIEEIRPVSIHPIRDYMGYGIRTGSDGSWGYISNSKTGVRLKVREGKEYVVSTNKPQDICDLVRWSRDRMK